MHSSDHILEIENNRRAEDLRVKVNLLKSYAKEIRDETKEQNRFLDTVQYAADSAGSMLGRTMGRIIGIPDGRHNNRKLLCMTILTFFAVFVIYTIVRHLPV
ncbi:blocked early in transport 1 [Echinococcus multilocularis]|uniref:Blocked early in transport 1 n=1 Tax=Echinococcus multilocularis TaxID=6211 RepID=A0A087W289_ECHMU|nr:blocked early in transport 1 [Echinococcus multilocularis]